MCFLQNISLFYFWLWWVSAAALGLFVLGWGLLSRCGPWAQLPCGMWGLRYRDWTHASCFGKQILTHWTTREIPVRCFSFFSGCAGIFFGEVSVKVLCPFLYRVVFLLLVLKVKKKKTYSGWFILCVNLSEPREAQRASKTLFLGVAMKVSPKRLVSREDMP